jgi:chromosome segregation ATPase
VKAGPLLVAALALASCDDQPKTDSDTAVQIEQADRQNQEEVLRNQIAELQTNATALQERTSELEDEVTTLQTSERVDSANINTAFENHKKLLDAYENHLRSLHGIQIAN